MTTGWTDPFDNVLCNAVGAMPRNRRTLGNRILASAARRVRTGRGGLLYVVEADDLAVDDVLDPELWWWRHRSPEHLDGVLLAGTRNRTTAGQAKWLPGAPPSSVNAARPILRVPVDVDEAASLAVGVMHMPKPKGGADAARRMVTNARGHDLDLSGMDANLRRRAVKARYPDRIVRAAEVMAQVGDPDVVEMSRVTTFDALPGTGMDDHPITRTSVRARTRKAHR